MTPDRILEIASKHQQYQGSKEMTLRGQAIVDVVQACMRELALDNAAPKTSQPYVRPGTHGAPAAPLNPGPLTPT